MYNSCFPFTCTLSKSKIYVVAALPLRKLRKLCLIWKRSQSNVNFCLKHASISLILYFHVCHHWKSSLISFPKSVLIGLPCEPESSITSAERWFLLFSSFSTTGGTYTHMNTAFWLAGSLPQSSEISLFSITWGWR